jgi:hypothetical protein
VLTTSYDLVRAAGLWLFSGPSNTDEDYERYLRSIRERDESMRGRETIAMVVLDRDNPPPNARWRKRIAESTRTMVSRPVAAFVVPSMAQRAVITAVNWLRPPPYEFTVHATFDEMVEHLRLRRPDVPTRIYRELLADARMEAARQSGSMRAAGSSR